ncbi:MAG TPA: L-erythro-3,5-diaminohexanoate dehydrogenase [Candidatus Rubrimentiphilum sp.]|nr:L-erythro-3,5-diaminohexanoate dehydrogenase [Candidatus Rubrimentiphilum sp.]
MKSHRYGAHRVIAPAGALPQNAMKLDNTPRPFANEILCDVEVLNLDSASFAQIRSACDDDPKKIADHISATVRERGKQHNAVTGSGGMFVGRVAEIGEALQDIVALREGDAIASLVSLTLTPLHLETITEVQLASGHVHVRGKAILFESAAWAKLPDDIDPCVALAVLDVAGAPAQIAKLAKPGMTIAVIGADGKSGLLVCAAARSQLRTSGRIIGVSPNANSEAARLLVESGLVDAFVAADARDALALSELVAAEAPQLADLVVNCVNVDGTELGSILCAKDGGTVYFFSMNTSFTAAALGAEGVGKDVTMLIGNGYTKHHADLALQTLRDNPAIHAYFTKQFAIRQPARTSL